jgi:hypothetical protein
VPEQDADDAASLDFRMAADREVVAAIAIHVPERSGDSTRTPRQLGAGLARENRLSGDLERSSSGGDERLGQAVQ